MLCAAWAQQLRQACPEECLGVALPKDVAIYLNGREKAQLRAHRLRQAVAGRALRLAHQDTDECFLLDARRYLKTHPVVFGNFTAQDLAKLVGYFGYSGPQLPARLQLRALKVTQKTLDSYHRHVQDFQAWASSKRQKVTAKNLDRLVVRYLTQLALEDAVLPSEGACLVFGLHMLKCTVPKADFLPEAQEALAAWRKIAPGGMRLPVPEEFVFDMATLAIDEAHPDIAFAMALQLDTYLRLPSPFRVPRPS